MWQLGFRRYVIMVENAIFCDIANAAFYLFLGVFNSSVHAKLVEVSEDEDIDEEKAGVHLSYEAEVQDEEEVEGQSADEEEQQIDDDEKSYPRKNSAGVNSYDNGIGLDTISEDSS